VGTSFGPNLNLDEMAAMLWLLAPMLVSQAIGQAGDGPNSVEEAKASGAKKISFKPPVLDEEMQDSVVRIPFISNQLLLIITALLHPFVAAAPKPAMRRMPGDSISLECGVSQGRA
jgi:hypothetical protein